MNKITVRPLEQWMLDTIRFDDRDSDIKQHIAGILQRNDARLFGAIEINSKIDGGCERLIGIGGVWKFGYVFGEWGLWLTSEVRERPFWLVKTCLRYMDLTCMEMDIRRLIALADISKPESGRFLECLGFGLQSNIPTVVKGIDCQIYEKAVI
jgi:hypothetical protein